MPMSVGEAMSNPEKIVPWLGKWVEGRRWSGLSGAKELAVKVADCAVLERTSDSVMLISVIEVEGARGGEDVHKCFFFPILLTRDLNHDDFLEVQCRDGSLAVAEAERTAEYNLRLLRELYAKEIRTRRGTIVLTRRKPLSLPSHAETSLLGKGDTTNLVAKIEGKSPFILKTYKDVSSENPEPEVLEVLDEAGFADAPKLLGEIIYEAQSPVAVGVLESYEENMGSGSQPFLAYLDEKLGKLQTEAEEKTLGGEAPKKLAKSSLEASPLNRSLAGLGGTIAEFHNAFAKSGRPLFQPEKVRPEDVEGWAKEVRASFDYCMRSIAETRKTSVSGSEQKVLAFFSEQLEDKREAVEGGAAFLGEASGLLKLRTHQDLHLEQLLTRRTRDGLRFLLIDFEGDPQRLGEARAVKELPLRDLGTMARSFGYVKVLSLAKALRGLPSAEAVPRASYLCARDAAPSAAPRLADEGGVWSCLASYVNGWEEAAEEAMVKGYLQRYGELGASYISDVPLAEGEVRRIVRFWKVEKALLEVRYEFCYRPQNLTIPLEGLLSAINGVAGAVG